MAFNFASAFFVFRVLPLATARYQVSKSSDDVRPQVKETNEAEQENEEDEREEEDEEKKEEEEANVYECNIS